MIVLPPLLPKLSGGVVGHVDGNLQGSFHLAQRQGGVPVAVFPEDRAMAKPIWPTR